MYIAILFSFALILIVFAGLTQNNYRKEIEQQATESAGVKKSLVTLTEENQKMNDTVKTLTEELDALKLERESLLSDREAMVKAIGGDESVTEILLDAYEAASAGNAEEARSAAAALNASHLTEAQKNIYNIIIGE